MTPEERRLHKRLGLLKGRIMNLAAKVEHMQMIFASDNYANSIRGELNES